MGSLGPEADDGSKEWNVLVTGFGPFLDNHTNPSDLIARSLPSKHTAQGLPSINIHAYPDPIEVCYKAVRDLIPTLLFKDESSPANYDIVLHIGLAPGRKHYSLESLAHRDGYNKKDIHNRTLENSTYWQDLYHAPEILLPTFKSGDVYKRWRARVVGSDLRVSNDAGRYLCEYTYFASMLEYWRRDDAGGRPCLFLHVPGGTGEADVRRGVEVTVGLIEAAVASAVAAQAKVGEEEELVAERERERSY